MNDSRMDEHQKQKISQPITTKDTKRLRDMAHRWMEIALSDEMREKKTAWKSVHDLKPTRPVIMCELFCLAGFVTEDDLTCEDEWLRNVERSMLYSLRQHETVKDDLVIEPYFRVAWKVSKSDYGVTIIKQHAENSIANLPHSPIKTPDDISKLKPRSFSVNRDETLVLKTKLDDIFGDILPVIIGNYDNSFSETGFTPYTGRNTINITLDLFQLIGNENMMFWAYDCPDALHRVLQFLRDDRARFFSWLQTEKILSPNTDNQFGGPSSYGYVSGLPEVGSKEKADLKDLWVFAESQETITVSPAMFHDIYLPYIADIANMFGLSYYGCCEAIDDRFEHLAKALPNLRSVSVSPWNDLNKMGELLGNNYVYSRKANATFFSGKTPDWDNLKKDMQDTFHAAKNGSLEIIVRDVYDIDGDMPRLAKWVEMTKSIVGI